MPKVKVKSVKSKEKGDKVLPATIRRLKVYYGSHQSNGYRRYPVIRLGGNYLYALAGLRIGDEIEVKLSEGRIEIRVL